MKVTAANLAEKEPAEDDEQKTFRGQCERWFIIVESSVERMNPAEKEPAEDDERKILRRRLKDCGTREQARRCARQRLLTGHGEDRRRQKDSGTREQARR